MSLRIHQPYENIVSKSTLSKNYFLPNRNFFGIISGFIVGACQSKFLKLVLKIMNHDYDVISMPLNTGNQKMNLTHHSLYSYLVQIFLTNSLRKCKILGVWMVCIHGIISEGQEISIKSQITIWHTISWDSTKKYNSWAKIIDKLKFKLSEHILSSFHFFIARNRLIKNLPIASEVFIVTFKLTYADLYIIWKEIFYWFQKYESF